MQLSYLIVGSGYRSKFYARIARTYPSLFRALFLCRSEEKAALIRQETGLPAVCTPEEGEAFKPDFVVVAVNKASLADVCMEWAQRGYPVLMETPAAMTIEQLVQLWELHQSGAKIAVAEQYHRYPELIPGLAAIAEGKIGTPGSAYLSLAHDYHGISLLRRMLLTDGEPYTIRGERVQHPVTETDSRTGPIPGNPVRDKARDLIWIRFASGKTAVYDFSGVQYHSFIRSRHLVVRGDRGEWNDTMLYRLGEKGDSVRDILTPVIPERYRELDTAALRDMRRAWRQGLSMDNVQDEFAIASMLYDMGDYIAGGAEVYPFREAMDDAYFKILMEEALADPWKEYKAEEMPWEDLPAGGIRLWDSEIGETEPIRMHGTTELLTERLTLRRYTPEDAAVLHERFGSDEAMFRYSGWNPYASPEMAQETVRKYIESYADPHFYGWAIDYEGRLAGTIGAYDYENDSIEVGISIDRSFWGRGFVSEALGAVLEYLTGNEKIARVTAWCAADNIGSAKVMEKAGMKLVEKKPGGLSVGDAVYDQLFYEYRR